VEDLGQEITLSVSNTTKANVSKDREKKEEEKKRERKGGKIPARGASFSLQGVSRFYSVAPERFEGRRKGVTGETQ